MQERETWKVQPILYLIVLLNNGIIHSLISWQLLLEVGWTIRNLDLGRWDLNNNNIDPWSFTMIQYIGWILTLILIEDFKFVNLDAIGQNSLKKKKCQINGLLSFLLLLDVGFDHLTNCTFVLILLYSNINNIYVWLF